MKPFNRRRSELSIQDGCVLWGSRVVILDKGRARVLQQLHDGHPGIFRMKSIARSSIAWWPDVDQQIEETGKSCTQCQQNQKAPAPVPLHS